MISCYVQDHEADRIMSLSQEAIDLYKNNTDKVIEDAYFLYRDDIDFINIVEKLGTEKASGEGSFLKLFHVPYDTFGVVYNPMRLGLSLTNDAKELFKKLAGYDFTENILRHDKYLVMTVQKLGDRASCYPMDMIEIEYIENSYIFQYIIDIKDGYEKVELYKGG